MQSMLTVQNYPKNSNGEEGAREGGTRGLVGGRSTGPGSALDSLKIAIFTFYHKVIIIANEPINNNNNASRLTN